MSDLTVSAVTIALLLLMALTFWRVAEDYRERTTLTPFTAFLGWLLYLSHAAVTVYASVMSIWPFPLPAPISVLAGVALIGASLTLFVAAMIDYSSFRRVSGMLADELVTGGSYAFTRNPQNIAWTLALFGVAMIGRSGLAILLALIFVAGHHFYLVRIEEPFLKRQYGDEWDDYSARVTRYVTLRKR